MATKRKIEALGELAETVRDALDELIEAVAEYGYAEDRETRADAAEMIDAAVGDAAGDVDELAKRLGEWE